MITRQHIISDYDKAQKMGILTFFQEAEERYGVEKEVLLGIASRETRMGTTYDSNGLGDNGNGVGIMQIDRRYHPEFTSRVSPFSHRVNILKGAEIYADQLRSFGGNIKAALAAYNGGPGGVRAALQAGLDPDIATTGGDYASDVVRRSAWFRELTAPEMFTGGFAIDPDIKRGLWMLGFSALSIFTVAITSQRLEQ